MLWLQSQVPGWGMKLGCSIQLMSCLVTTENLLNISGVSPKVNVWSLQLSWLEDKKVISYPFVILTQPKEAEALGG